MEAITLTRLTNNLKEDLTPNQNSNSTQDVSTKITMEYLLPEETASTKIAILNDHTI